MSHFKINNFNINDEKKEQSEMNISEFNAEKVPQIKEYNLSAVYKKEDRDYSALKSKYGALAVTDADRLKKSQKDSRFALNPLLRDPLSIEEEERRAIEEKVRVIVDSLAEEAKSSASNIGYEEGFRKGSEEAFKKMQQENADNIQRFDELVKTAENAKIEIFKANERFLIELVFKISKMLILKELKTDEGYVLRLLKELINRVGIKDNIKIHINPDDFRTVDALKGGLEQSYGTLNNVTIESSLQVKYGGCSIETEWNTIDASLETQLQGIYDTLISKN